MNIKKAVCALLAAACMLFAADTVRENDPSQRNKPYLLLIGLDGFRFDYAEKYGAKHILAFRDAGSSAEALIPSYPSLTFPNFYTLATGLLPAHHGIVANRFWDPARQAEFDFHKNGEDGSWYGGTPIWVLAEQQGMRSAAYFWPGTGGEIQHSRPTYYKSYDHATQHAQQVQQVLDWFRLPESQRPHLVTLYFSDVDAAGHRFGPDSEEVRAAVQKVDATVGELLEALKTMKPAVNVVILADHGMLPVERAVDFTADADLSGFHVEADGPMAMLYSSDSALVESTYQKLHGKSPLYTVYRRGETPREWRYTRNDRIGDLILVASGPYVLTNRPGPPQKGNHGFDPSKFPLMRGIFYAAGPDIKSGVRLPPFANTEVFPLEVDLLGLKAPEKLDGSGDVARKLALSSSATQQSDRDVAEWVLRQGGRVTVNGARRPILDPADLPQGELHLTGVDLTGTQIDPTALKKLSGLSELRELLLPGPMWNPGAGSKLDANDELADLKDLHKLERLQFSLHFLTNINIQDKGVALLAPLTQLRELRLAETKVKGKTLAPFVHLRGLDVNETPFNDDGMESLKGMTELERLSVRDTLVTDDGLKSIAGLKSLRALDLYGDRISDAGLASLKDLTNLEELNLLGAAVSDAGLDALAGMTHLRELNLYRTEVTNAGLAKLKAMPQLAALDLRYTRVTRGGIDALRASIPKLNVEFIDTSITGAGAVAPVMHSKGEKALADWVRAMGGKAEQSGGRLIGITLANTAVTDQQLANLSEAADLEKLSLETTQIGDLGAKSIGALRELRELNLSQTTVSDTGLESLADLKKLQTLILDHTLVRGPGLNAVKNMTGLQRLDLVGTGVSSLDALAGLSNLERLNLSYTDVVDENLTALAPLDKLRFLDLTATEIGDKALANLKPLTALTELRLNYGRFTDKGLGLLAALPNLERLEVARTPVTDHGLEALSPLIHMKYLNLNYTKVTDAGLATLQSFPQLTDLELDSAGISDAGVDALRARNSLKVLNLYHTLVSEKGDATLKAALPGCRIIWDRDSALPNRRGS